MEAKSVKSSELGTNCWLPLRFFGHCHRCKRFDACKYPEKNVSPEVQAKLDHMKKLQAEVRKIQEEMAACGEELYGKKDAR